MLAGAANAFDILPYNAYYWGDDLSSADWKTPYLRNLMTTYNVPLKPMLMTETGLLCDPGCPKLQAYAVGRYYTRALSLNLLGTMWYIYDSDEFHNTAMVEPQNPDQHRPAYQAYQHAVRQLKGVTYVGVLTGQPSGIEGYRFARPDGALTVFWSSKAQPVSIPVDPERHGHVYRMGWRAAAMYEYCRRRGAAGRSGADLSGGVSTAEALKL